MTRKALAEEFRGRLQAKGLVPEELLQATTDDDMIESYFTCSCCKKKQLEDNMLNWLIGKAQNADQLFNMVNQVLGKTDPCQHN